MYSAGEPTSGAVDGRVAFDYAYMYITPRDATRKITWRSTYVIKELEEINWASSRLNNCCDSYTI